MAGKSVVSGRLTSVRLGEIDIIDLLERVTLGVWEPAPPGTYGPYTPAEELRDRLNARARGETPGDPINWKGLPHGRQL